MDKFDKGLRKALHGVQVDEAGTLTKGMIKALGYTMKLKKICDKCGFMMPKYSGRYPKYCPMCSDPVNAKDKEVITDEHEVPTGETHARHHGGVAHDSQHLKGPIAEGTTYDSWPDWKKKDHIEWLNEGWDKLKKNVKISKTKWYEIVAPSVMKKRIPAAFYRSYGHDNNLKFIWSGRGIQIKFDTGTDVDGIDPNAKEKEKFFNSLSYKQFKMKEKNLKDHVIAHNNAIVRPHPNGGTVEVISHQLGKATLINVEQYGVGGPKFWYTNDKALAAKLSEYIESNSNKHNYARTGQDD
jgi:uncharacterized Zn finger protein (UPF0148 family)